MNENLVNDSMQLILHAGNAKSMIMEAMYEVVETKDVELAKHKLEEAGKELGKAHEIQTSLLFNEMQGKSSSSDVGILMVHAQDHFMNAITMKDMAQLMLMMMEG